MSSDVLRADAEMSTPVARLALFIDAATPQDHAFRTVLHRQRYEVEEVADVRTALHAARERRFDLVVVGSLLSAMPTLDDLIDVLRDRLGCPLVCVKRERNSVLELERVAREFANTARKRRHWQVGRKAE